MASWPSEDLAHAPTNGVEPAWPAAELEPEPMVAETGAEPEPEPMVAETAVAAAALDGGPTEEYPPLHVVSWEEDSAIALEPEPEPLVAETVPESDVEPELPAAQLAVPEPEPEAEIPAAAAVVEPEPEMPAPRPIRPISETILLPPEQPPVAPDADRVAAQADDASLAARKAQLDLLGIGDPGQGTVGPDRSNVLPYRSSGASVSAQEMAMRTASGLPAPAAFWEASAREVAGAMSHVGVHACGECGLSLSASARFCRRCGTRQAQPA
jgi:ribosomal protein L40E